MLAYSRCVMHVMYLKRTVKYQDAVARSEQAKEAYQTAQQAVRSHRLAHGC
jgi:hypothetical protein